MMPLRRLIETAFAEPSDDGADSEVEEHVLSCDECARRYAALLRLGPAIAELVRAGGVSMPITPTLAERLVADGLVTRRYSTGPGQTVACTVASGDIYTLVTYSADLTGVSRVDLMRAGERMQDIPFDAVNGAVYVLAQADQLLLLPSGRISIRIFAVDGAGERVVGEYTMDHTAPH